MSLTLYKNQKSYIFSKSLFYAMFVLGLGSCKKTETFITSKLRDFRGDAGTESGEKREVLSESERSQLYHLSQGSEVFPLAILKALKVPNPLGGSSTIPFMSNINFVRMGFIGDPVSKNNPEGLPVGMTLAHAVDTGLLSVGFNCTACHVREIDYQDKSGSISHIRLDGAPAMSDVRLFYSSALEALTENIKSRPVDFVRDAARYELEIRKTYPATSNTATQNDLENILGVLRDVYSISRDLAVGGSKTVENKILTLLNNSPFEESQRRFLLARWYFVGAALKISKMPNLYGPGRSDAFNQVKLQLFARNGFDDPLSASVSTPSLWHTERFKWYHYNQNTNGILDRSVANAIGMGALVDSSNYQLKDGKVLPPTFKTSVNFQNLRLIDETMWKVAPPSWPPNAPRAEQVVIEKGRTVFESTCATCHVPRANGGLIELNMFPVSQIGVDTGYFESFLRPVPGGTLASAMTELLGIVKRGYFQSDNKKQEEWEGRVGSEDYRRPEVQWRDRSDPSELQVRAPMLHGVWATAPYLHNGSVPTLRDLLEKPDARPKKFLISYSGYDMVRVGLPVSESKRVGTDSKFIFDTSKTGNSNRGHEFGTDLPGSDKDALVEFLKGYGGGGQAPLTRSN